ncbi:hypothetical protein ACC691_37295, partial [Rhizobium johnstonii]|uniref:hypothetical protein n=1 Tax=Rhizobium johnstonii TaxID=3019933 RepID=UPI003F97898C
LAEVMLATRLSRVRWFLAYLVIGLVSVSLVLLAGLLGALAGASSSPDAGARDSTIIAASVAQLPAIVLLLAVVALVFAVAPRWTIGLGWAILLVAIFIGQFGALFGLPLRPGGR